MMAVPSEPAGARRAGSSLRHPSAPTTSSVTLSAAYDACFESVPRWLRAPGTRDSDREGIARQRGFRGAGSGREWERGEKGTDGKDRRRFFDCTEAPSGGLSDRLGTSDLGARARHRAAPQPGPLPSADRRQAAPSFQTEASIVSTDLRVAAANSVRISSDGTRRRDRDRSPHRLANVGRSLMPDASVRASSSPRVSALERPPHALQLSPSISPLPPAAAPELKALI